MKVDSTREKFLSNSLEKIIFNENDFNKLKQTINDLTLGLIESKKLKEIIINSRYRLLEELLEFFPFYLKHNDFQHSIKGFTKESENPDLVIVVGDVNSTAACSMVAAKMGVAVAHVEAGLRSFDRKMPEEINRILTDMLSTYLFTTCEEANENLLREGVARERVFLVGDVMIDTLYTHLETIREMDTWRRMGLKKVEYAVLTLHRPSNVDDRDVLGEIITALEKIAKHLPVIFPIHPRTRKAVHRRFDGVGYEPLHLLGRHAVRLGEDGDHDGRYVRERVDRHPRVAEDPHGDDSEHAENHYRPRT